MQILRFPFQTFKTPLQEFVPLLDIKPANDAPANEGEEVFIDLPTHVSLTQEEIAAKEEAARVLGFQDGFTQGMEQGTGEKKERDEKLAELLQQLTIAVASVQNMYQEAASEFKQALVGLSSALAHKIAGRALKEKPDEAILQMLEGLLPNLIAQPELLIEVHPDVADSLQEKIISVSSAQGFTGQLKVVASAEVPLGDCKVEWAQGKAVLNQSTLQQKINDLLGV